MALAASRRWRLAMLAAAAVAVAWLATREPTPHHATSDLYTHLSVARHLIQGDGFVNDTVYPLSLAFPFAAYVPQPLVHRPPGYPLLLTLPVALSGDDPARAERLTGGLSVLLLSLIAACGVAFAVGRGRGEAVLPWLIVLLVNPLLHMTVGWSQVEIPVALLLLWLWIRLRDRDGSTATTRTAAVDGLLAAAVALLRADLFWLPWLWLIWTEWRHDRRAWLVGATCWAAVLAPWWIRNAVLSGDPFFTLQAYAEHLKETPAWPGYAIYASLTPESLWHTLRHDPALIFDKFLGGLRYYLARLENWLPTVLWLAGGLAALRLAWRTRRPGGPLTLLGASLAALILVYAPFSHTLRYMAVLLPVLSLELWLAVAGELAAHPVLNPHRYWRQGLMLALAAACVWILPARMPGWERARDTAALSAATRDAALARLATVPAGPIFTDSAALLWYGGRAGIWLPAGSTASAEVRAACPDMTRAPTIRQGPLASGSGDD